MALAIPMAIAAINSLYQNGISVPSEVALAGITDIEMAKLTVPPLTTVRIPAEEIGTIAADMLLARMNGYSRLPQRIILPTSLIVRDST